MAPPLWHPSWKAHGELEVATKVWQQAERERQQVEEQVKRELQSVGYQLCYEVWRDEVKPLVEQLAFAAEKFEAIRQQAETRTGNKSGDMGFLSLSPVGSRDFLEQADRKVWGPCGVL